MVADMLEGFPEAAPAAPKKPLRYADIAVTASAKDFQGIYRSKKYHPPDFTSVLDRAREHNVHKILLTGMSLSDISLNLELAQSHPQQCHMTVGIHPYHASEPSSDPTYLDVLFSQLRTVQSQQPNTLRAYGELGLDYDHLEWCSEAIQIEVFKAQLDRFISEGLNTTLPLFLHCRAAYDDFVETITPYMPQLPKRGVIHSFVGSSSQAQHLISLGFDVSVNGFSFRTRESLEMVRDVPLEHLQIETDAPWGVIQPSSEVAKRYLVNARPLPAAKKRDKWSADAMVKERNESCHIERVCMIVAGIKALSTEEVAGASWANSCRMFGFEVGHS